MDKGSATIGGGKVWDPLTGRKDTPHARKETAPRVWRVQFPGHPVDDWSLFPERKRAILIAATGREALGCDREQDFPRSLRELERPIPRPDVPNLHAFHRCPGFLRGRDSGRPPRVLVRRGER